MVSPDLPHQLSSMATSQGGGCPGLPSQPLPHLRQWEHQGPRDEVHGEADSLCEVLHSPPLRGLLRGCWNHPDHQDGHHLPKALQPAKNKKGSTNVHVNASWGFVFLYVVRTNKRGLIKAEQLFKVLKGCKEVREKENSSKVLSSLSF